MGDRIAIQFSAGTEVSPVLFSHWGGSDVLNDAIEFLAGKHTSFVGEAMLEFIIFLKDKYGKHFDNLSCYLGVDERMGDASDNGLFVFDLDTGKIKTE